MTRTCSTAAAAPAFPYPHRTVAAVDRGTPSAGEAKAIRAATRALVWMLLETHSQKDVHAMMQRTVSGAPFTVGQVRAIRKRMLEKGAIARPKNVPLPHVRDEPPVAAAVPAIAAPQPVAVAPAAVVRRPPAPPETFESQMARIAAGARLIAAPDFRTCGPSYTLGGVASGML